MVMAVFVIFDCSNEYIHKTELMFLQAIMWLDELFEVMLISHAEVGCSVYEIQRQKEEQQNFEETAKVLYYLLCS